jgi:hypothetical protein
MKKIVYVIDKPDDIKYFNYLLQLCIKHNVELYYLNGTPVDNCVDKKHHIPLVEHELMLYSIHHLSSMLDEVLYVVKPQLLYHIDI